MVESAVLQQYEAGHEVQKLLSMRETTQNSEKSYIM
jgi:hypothetical protein